VSAKRAPWWFLAMMASVGLAPLLLIEWFKAPDGYNTGEPTRRLIELARGGLGGYMPGGFGPIPREATVSMGVLLIAAWLWIAFCALAIVGRMLPWTSVRRVFLLLSPLVLGLLSFVQACRRIDMPVWFDQRSFWPMCTESGVWVADPMTLRSFGPVLVAAVIIGILLAVLIRLPGWRRGGKDRSFELRAS